ncbi:hypothetical protein ACTWQB_14715 [Piscibacillus sp. B03]|uniref:hypothetical protein n=1 Tax=Piscibacillus sp. B03 TaxID=3457430 RepID=UPI003FCDA050
MIEVAVVNKMINDGLVNVIWESQRCSPISNIKSKTISYGSHKYKLCVACGVYRNLNNYTPNAVSQDGKVSICKDCRNQREKGYYQEFIKNTQARWSSLKQETGIETCSLDEFREFCKHEKCKITNRTIEQDIENQSINNGLRLWISRKIPVSLGGSSHVDNLEVLPRFISHGVSGLSPAEYSEIKELYLSKMFIN